MIRNNNDGSNPVYLYVNVEVEGVACQIAFSVDYDADMIDVSKSIINRLAAHDGVVPLGWKYIQDTQGKANAAQQQPQEQPQQPRELSLADRAMASTMPPERLIQPSLSNGVVNQTYCVSAGWEKGAPFLWAVGRKYPDFRLKNTAPLLQLGIDLPPMGQRIDCDIVVEWVQSLSTTSHGTPYKDVVALIDRKTGQRISTV